MDSTSAPGSVFSELADVVYASPDLNDVFAAIVHAAPAAVAGCDHASIMLRTGNRFEIAMAGSDVARRVDEAEIRLGQGPCLDALTDEAAQFDPDLTRNSPWPELSEWVMEHTPVRGSLGYRLVLDGAKAGALNLFSERRRGFTEASADQGAVLAAFASVALAAGHRGQDANTARSGLESNRVIGKAIGLLMAFHQVDDDAAFEVLRQTSQDLNLKLADVAQEVVAHHRKR